MFPKQSLLEVKKLKNCEVTGNDLASQMFIQVERRSNKWFTRARLDILSPCLVHSFTIEELYYSRYFIMKMNSVLKGGWIPK
jgi:hypothetical protein